MLEKLWNSRNIPILLCLVLLTPLLMGNSACSKSQTSDDIERRRQETLLKEAGSQVGMPAITNFREKKFMKEILEDRDKGIVTYTYAYSEMLACYRKLPDTLGYPIPYATQFTNPEKAEYVSWASGWSYLVLPQADPNALFSPGSAEATWSLMINPAGGKKGTDGKPAPQVGPDKGPGYSEPKLSTFPFPLPDHLMCDNVMKNFAETLATALKK